MICPECKNDILDGISVCPVCGFDLSSAKWECEECHTFVDNNIDVCPMCGASKKVVEQFSTKDVIHRKRIIKSKKIGLALFIVACILFALGFTKINNRSYKFYKQHYAECEEGYGDTKLRGYDDIANNYIKMMDDDMKEINSFRIQTGIYWVAGTVLLVIGIKKGKE